MSEILLAKSAGFCFGVQRAVNTVYDEINKCVEMGEPIYTFGPIIHNEQVVEDLEKKGVTVVNEIEEFKKLPKGTVVIRSHGVSKEINDKLDEMGFKVVDSTCPFVKKIHRTVLEKGQEGYEIIIIGNANHPEVEGIKGWCVTNTIIINSFEEAENLKVEEGKKVCVVSQTTFNYNKFDKLVEIIAKKLYDIIVVNTICNATNERQVEARQIAKSVDMMIVIGGKTSSNTQKLYEICKEECVNTIFVQTVADLYDEKLLPSNKIGITAGASTPKNIIEEVQNYVRIKF